MKKFDFSIGKTIQLVFLFLSVLIILYLGININPILALLVGIIPLALASSLFVFSNSFYTFALNKQSEM